MPLTGKVPDRVTGTPTTVSLILVSARLVSRVIEKPPSTYSWTPGCAASASTIPDGSTASTDAGSTSPSSVSASIEAPLAELVREMTPIRRAATVRYDQEPGSAVSVTVPAAARVSVSQ